MRYLIILGFLLLLPWQIRAQYLGGNGDGLDQSGFVQSTLDGVPAGVQPLFVGGSGDGFARLSASSALAGDLTLSVFGGGRGDGFDQFRLSASLSGAEVAGLYAGGDGDGFDAFKESASLDGIQIAGLFGGGEGDGFDQLSFSSSIGGTDILGLYAGGDGDGFDRFTVSTGLMGFMSTGLYGGGAGDGFDKNSHSSSIGGVSIAGLFGGGAGDGFDVARSNNALPLPLTLISFEAIPEEQYVLLRWVTETEINTNFFTIEKTKDLRDFSWVGEMDAAGFSEPGEQIHYELKDHDPYAGTSYYRLKTTDFDGAISLSHLVAVHYDDHQDWSFNLFPNPNTGKHFSISLGGETNEASMMVEVYDVHGRLLLQELLDSALRDSQRFDLKDRLPSGSYLIRVIHPDQGQQSKILLIGK